MAREDSREDDREDDRAKLEAMKNRGRYDNDPSPTMCEETREKIRSAIYTAFRAHLDADPVEAHPLFYPVEVDSEAKTITVRMVPPVLCDIAIDVEISEDVSQGESIPARSFILWEGIE